MNIFLECYIAVLILEPHPTLYSRIVVATIKGHGHLGFDQAAKPVVQEPAQRRRSVVIGDPGIHIFLDRHFLASTQFDLLNTDFSHELRQVFPLSAQ